MTDFKTEFDRYYEKALSVLEHSGSTDEVYTYITGIADEDYRDSTFTKVASFLAEQRDLKNAIRFCDAIQGAVERADALIDIGRLLVKHNSLDSAKELFRKAVEAAGKVRNHTYDAAAILLQAADELERLGQRGEALDLLHRAVELAKPTPQNFEAGKILRGCARVLARWNRLDEAAEVARAIELPQLRQTASEEIRGGGKWPVNPGVN
jgi:tetratricopeptide (TPR) repeat protein